MSEPENLQFETEELAMPVLEDVPEEKSIKKSKYGLIINYKKSDESIGTIFPEEDLSGIKWIYVSKKKENKDEIEGDIYNPTTLSKIVKKHEKGYHVIVMPNFDYEYATGSKDLLFYTLSVPLITASKLLRPKGEVWTNYFAYFATRYLDDTIFNVLQSKNNNTSVYQSLGLELIREEIIHNATELSFDNKVIAAIETRIGRLLKDKTFLENIFYPFLDKLCLFSGFTATIGPTRIETPGGSHLVKFIK